MTTRDGTLTVLLNFRDLPDGMPTESYEGEPVIKAGETVDISPICDSRQAKINMALVGEDLKSVTSTAGIIIPASVDSYNVRFKRSLMLAVMHAATTRSVVRAWISYKGKALFTGVLDLKNLDIESTGRYQGGISLTVKDDSYMLDEKIARSVEIPDNPVRDYVSGSTGLEGVFYYDDTARKWYTWDGAKYVEKTDLKSDESPFFPASASVRVWNKNAPEVSAVGVLLKMAGYTVANGLLDAKNSDSCTDDIRLFAYDTSEDKTYRDVLDTLLKEHCLCLTTTPEGAVVIRSLLVDDVAPKREIGVNLKDASPVALRDGIKTGFEVYAHDGLKLTYSSSLAVRRQQNVFSDQVGGDVGDDGSLSGTAIAPQSCYPTDGDITATYQEYNASFLDRAYTTKESRKQNEDLSIVSTRGAYLEVAEKGASWQPSTKLEYPKITQGASAEFADGANPYFTPKKAQVLLYNPLEKPSSTDESAETENEGKTIHLQIFNVVADVLYREHTSVAYCPSAVADPEEYTATYIFTKAQAEKYASFFVDWMQDSRMQTDWVEYGGDFDDLGTIVGYQHTESPVSSYCMVSKLTLSMTGSAEKPFRLQYHGIGVRPYSAKPLSEVRYTGKDSSKGQDGRDGKQGEKGKDGEPSPVLVFDTASPVNIDAYADGPVVSYDNLRFTASVSINGEAQTGWAFGASTTDGLSVTIDPDSGLVVISSMDDSADNGIVTVTAAKAQTTLKNRISVVKTKRAGGIRLSVDKPQLKFYWDDVAHDRAELATITVSLTGYSPDYRPVCSFNGADAPVPNLTYTFTAQALEGKDSGYFYAQGSGQSASIDITKLMDTPYAEMHLSRTSIGYYADKVEHGGEDACTVTLVAAGVSSAPSVSAGATEVPVTAGQDGVYTASVTAKELVGDTTAVTATYGPLTRTAFIAKAYDTPTLSLGISRDFFSCYADSVMHEDETPIALAAAWSGLYHKPVVTVDGQTVELDENNQYAIPPSAVASKDSITVEAHSAYIDTKSLQAVRTIRKQYDEPAVNLVADATQFHEAEDGSVSPGSVTVTPAVSGLSKSATVEYSLGGEAVTLTDGKYVITADKAKTYLTMTASWDGELLDTLTLLRTKDGVSMKYWYASAPEGWLPGGYPFGTDQTAIGEADTAIGQLYGWSEDVPVVKDGYVLWIKTVAPDGGVFVYRPQGLQGKGDGVYLGVATSTNLPVKRPDGSDIQEGDYYLDITDPADPVVYIMKNGLWTVMDTTSALWQAAASKMMGDVSKYCPGTVTTNSFYGFFHNLSATNGFIQGLGTRELTIMDDGFIQSSNYASSGGTEGFYLPADGNAVFETGLFRGGVANGWVMFGGLNIEIPETMTQKELYSIFRKAGVGSGLYFAGPDWAYYRDGFEPPKGSDAKAMLDQTFSLFQYYLSDIKAPVTMPAIAFSGADSGAAYEDFALYAIAPDKVLLTAVYNSKTSETGTTQYTTYYARSIDLSGMRKDIPCNGDAENSFSALQMKTYMPSSLATLGEDVSSIIPRGSITMIHDGQIHLNSGEVYDTTFKKIGTESSPAGKFWPYLPGQLRSPVDVDGTTYMFAYVGEGDAMKLCVVSSSDGLSWSKELETDVTDTYTHCYSPVPVDGTWYWLVQKWTKNGEKYDVTPSFVSTTDGKTLSTIWTGPTVTWTTYEESERCNLCYAGGKIWFATSAEGILHSYGPATKTLAANTKAVNLTMIEMPQQGTLWLRSAFALPMEATKVLSFQYLPKRNKILVIGASKMLGISGSRGATFSRLIDPATGKVELLGQITGGIDEPSAGSAFQTAFGIYDDGVHLCIPLGMEVFTTGLPGHVTAPWGYEFDHPMPDKICMPAFCPTALHMTHDPKAKTYDVAMVFPLYASDLMLGEFVTGDRMHKTLTIDGTSDDPVPFSGWLKLRPSLSGPDDAILFAGSSTKHPGS